MSIVDKDVRRRFGRLVLIKEVASKFDRRNYKVRMVLCLCDCGATRDVRYHDLKRGQIASCGCITRERLTKLRVTHGLKGHPLYAIWSQMKGRCYRVKHNSYKNYGARGIKICPEWLSDFQSFYTWATTHDWGPDLQIDRRDNDGPYSPANCRWVVSQVNANNKRNNIVYTYFGTALTLSEASREYNICRGTLKHRIQEQGYSPARCW